MIEVKGAKKLEFTGAAVFDTEGYDALIQTVSGDVYVGGENGFKLAVGDRLQFTGRAELYAPAAADVRVLLLNIVEWR